jgi:hypothetical protein
MNAELVYLSFLMWDRPELKSGIWFLSGAVAALVFFELTVGLFYFLPKAAYQLIKGAVSAGLLLFFLRAVAYRFIALLLLWFFYAAWGPLYHRAFSLGISITLAVYGSYAFTKRSRTGLSESFFRNSAQYQTERPT